MWPYNLQPTRRLGDHHLSFSSALQQYSRDVGRSENQGGGRVKIWGHNIPPTPIPHPPVKKGLIHLPKTVGARSRPPIPHPLGSDNPEQYTAGAEEARNFKLHEIQMATWYRFFLEKLEWRVIFRVDARGLCLSQPACLACPLLRLHKLGQRSNLFVQISGTSKSVLRVSEKNSRFLFFALSRLYFAAFIMELRVLYAYQRCAGPF